MFVLYALLSLAVFVGKVYAVAVGKNATNRIAVKIVRFIIETICINMGQQYIITEKYENTMYMNCAHYNANECPSSSCQLPLVKSGISTGAPPIAADFSVSSTRQLHSAAS